MPAFQFPSWYNRASPVNRGGQVLPAFQFPSWYNSRWSRFGVSCRLAGLPIPQLVQSCKRSRSAARWSCRPSNSPVGTISDSGGAVEAQVLPAFQFPSWYNCALVGMNAPLCLAGLPIPQLVQFLNPVARAPTVSCRPSNSPVGTICSCIGRGKRKSCRPSNSPVGTIRHDLLLAGRQVLPAFQFPSWYNRLCGD